MVIMITYVVGMNGFCPMTFEVTPLSLQHITVTFEHPVRECIATGKESTNVSPECF